MIKRAFALVLVLAGIAVAQERPDARRVYRFDFVVAESVGGKAASSTTYTINLREQRTGEIRRGTNVALAGPTPGATMRADIGLVLRATYSLAGEDLLVESDVEISAPGPSAQTFHKMAAKGDALIAPGKPALVASIEDPVAHVRYQVTATATRLR